MGVYTILELQGPTDCEYSVPRLRCTAGVGRPLDVWAAACGVQVYLYFNSSKLLSPTEEDEER